jgi:hypothetical protein
MPTWTGSCVGDQSVKRLGQPTHPPMDKPSWVDPLEESLLLAISLFALITWIVLIALLSH